MKIYPLFLIAPCKEVTVNPLIAKTILASGSNKCKSNFVAHLKHLKDSSWVSSNTFNAYYDTAKATYGDLASFSKSNGSNVSFENFIANKLKAVNKL